MLLILISNQFVSTSDGRKSNRRNLVSSKFHFEENSISQNQFGINIYVFQVIFLTALLNLLLYTKVMELYTKVMELLTSKSKQILLRWQ